ncbi:hypothetical protein ACKFKG_12160 [Phormidesmis sp. 146-35]
MTATLTIVQDTWLTLTQSQSTDLPDNQKHHVLAGESFALSSYEFEGEWLQLTLDRDRLSQPNPFGEHLIWYVNWADVIIDSPDPRGGDEFFENEPRGGSDADLIRSNPVPPPPPLPKRKS